MLQTRAQSAVLVGLERFTTALVRPGAFAASDRASWASNHQCKVHPPASAGRQQTRERAYSNRCAGPIAHSDRPRASVDLGARPRRSDGVSAGVSLALPYSNRSPAPRSSADAMACAHRSFGRRQAVLLLAFDVKPALAVPQRGKCAQSTVSERAWLRARACAAARSNCPPHPPRPPQLTPPPPPPLFVPRCRHGGRRLRRHVRHRRHHSSRCAAAAHCRCAPNHSRSIASLLLPSIRTPQARASERALYARVSCSRRERHVQHALQIRQKERRLRGGACQQPCMLRRRCALPSHPTPPHPLPHVATAAALSWRARVPCARSVAQADAARCDARLAWWRSRRPRAAAEQCGGSGGAPSTQGRTPSRMPCSTAQQHRQRARRRRARAACGADTARCSAAGRLRRARQAGPQPPVMAAAICRRRGGASRRPVRE